MKKAVIFILLAALILYGCKAKQSIVAEETTATLIDTTHTETDSMSAVSIFTDTTKATSHTEQAAVIEFVDSGGAVSIDTAGNVTIKGIKSIKGIRKADVAEAKGVAKRDTVSESHTDTAKGVTKRDTQSKHKEVKTSRAIRWWERPLIWIGALYCIAAILWLIFIYIHKKH